MFSTLAFFLTAFLALFVTALPTPGGSPTLSQCNTGPVQCCQSVHQSNSTAGAFLLGAVGVPIQNLVTSVGFDCSPISLGIVGGAMGSGAKCASQPVCCNQAFFSGLVSNGCDPINIQM